MRAAETLAARPEWVVSDGLTPYPEALAAMEDGSASPAAMMRVTRAVLGDAYNDVKAHVRDADGKVNADAMGEFLQQVFEALNAGN